MNLWKSWSEMVERLRPAFKRTRTFLWFAAALAAMCIRPDLAGVSSLVRALGLKITEYDRLLDMFHSRAIDLQRLARVWTRTVITVMGRFILRDYAGRAVFLCDGIKVPKAGRKMPGVKKLHQESDGNTKPEYIFGHSCQAVAVAVQAARGIFALPLACRIHEGVVFSNRDRRTLLDKMAALALDLGVEDPAVLVGDAYYAAGKLIRSLLAAGWHLVTAAKSNAVAYFPPTPMPAGARGRPRVYGEKVLLRSLFEHTRQFQEAPSPVYSESNVRLSFRSLDLLWKPAGRLVRFVLVVHPTRGRRILLCTDVAMPPIEIIRLYGIRFKIEVSFKQAVHTVGTYAYHFWMAAMKPRPRRSGDQYMHRESRHYRDAVRRKLHAYHCHLQMGVIAQGLMQCLAVTQPRTIWRLFGSWLRTVRPGLPPSERVVAVSLRNALVHFLAVAPQNHYLAKFIRPRIDPDRAEGMRLAS